MRSARIQGVAFVLVLAVAGVVVPSRGIYAQDLPSDAEMEALQREIAAQEAADKEAAAEAKRSLTSAVSS